MTTAFVRHTTERGTRLAIQQIGDSDPATRLILFDGRPMIEDGVPEALAQAHAAGTLPALSAVYVESIEGATKRGRSRCASLTTPAVLERFAVELEPYVDRSPTTLIGHSLGAIAALHLACTTGLSHDLVLLSPALWWPGDDGQLAGEQVIDETVRGDGLRIWMTVGEKDDEQLRATNGVLVGRLNDVGRPPERHSHPGGHPARPEDVVAGVRWLHVG